jgi:hypothetical protein
VRAAVQPIGNGLQQSCLTGLMCRADLGRLNKHSPGRQARARRHLPGGGVRTIFLAAGRGSTRVGATVQPASDLAMPAWAAR